MCIMNKLNVRAKQSLCALLWIICNGLEFINGDIYLLTTLHLWCYIFSVMQKYDLYFKRPKFCLVL